MLHLGRAYAEGECTKCTMRGCMAIAANNRHARLSKSLLWTDYMDNALTNIINWNVGNAKLFDVTFQSFYL